jgi:hypothetical protein
VWARKILLLFFNKGRGMKKFLSLVCLSLFSFGVSEGRFSNINRLIRAEVTPHKDVSRVILEFDRPFYYEKREAVPGRQIRLYFPGIEITDFTKLRIAERIRCVPVVESAFLHYERVPVPRVVLVVNFAKDAAIIRFTKAEEPNLLTFDIFEKEVLELIRRKSTTTRYACNSTIKKKGRSNI